MIKSILLIFLITQILLAVITPLLTNKNNEINEKLIPRVNIL